MSRSTPRSLAMTARLPLIVAAVLAALTLLAGCGGDTGRAQTPAASASLPSAASVAQPGPAVPTQATDPQRRAYVKRVDQICTRLDPERNAVRVQVAKAPDAREAATAYQETITLGARQLRQIEAIPAPQRDRAALQANVFDVVNRQLAIRRQMHTALAAADVTRLQSLRQQLDDLTRSLAAFARGYGFQACGEE